MKNGETAVIDLEKNTLRELVTQLKKNGAQEVLITNIRKRFSCEIDMFETGNGNSKVNQQDITGLLFTEEGFQFEGGVGMPVSRENVQTVILSEGGVLRLLFQNGTEKVLGIQFNERRTDGSNGPVFAEEEALRTALSDLTQKAFPNATFRYRTEQESIAEWNN